jgi:pimeloyl-ACP methyl ester carboxylesterase
MAERPDMRPLLGQIAVPTLVIVGASDAISPVDEMRSVAEGIPGAKLIIAPQAGHMAPLENPAAVNRALVEFLAGIP